MRYRFSLGVAFLLVCSPFGWSQENDLSSTERLDGTIKGIIVGLSRVTVAVLSHNQIVTFLHTHPDKMPQWVRSGIDVTIHYKRESDGSFWIEKISPYKPPEIVTNPFIYHVSSQSPVSALSQQNTSPQPSAPASPSRQGSALNLREKQLASRGLDSLRERIATIDPVETEVKRLLPHYKAAAKFFNPNLSDEQAEIIAASILRSSIQRGIDPRLVVAVIACESSFKPEAVGKKGEIGLGQLKPETAAGLGVNPYDPVQNIDGCVQYLRQQLDRFGSLELALAAYNAGQNAVIKAGGIPQNNITPRYVQKVLKLYQKLCGQ